MATRDKYNFTQQTIDWGTIIYNDVPSYSITSVGTTGNAYLVRNFLKKFFPFLDLSVNKTSGGSVNVKIKSYVVKFKFEENGVDKEFLLNTKALEDILEPLFEGQGFDGMTDSTYSKPIPPMYNDLGQDVSYGYGYLFVGADNLDSIYEVDLDVPLASSKYQFKVVRNDGPIMFDQKLQIPQKTEDYIKRVANSISSSPSTQTNQSDFVTLEKGYATLSLTTLEQELIDFLAEKQQKNVNVTLKEIISEFQNRNYERDLILNRMGTLVAADLIDSKSYNSDLVYFLMAKGLDYVSNPAVQILVEDATPVSKPIPMATEGEMASFKFISQNIDTLKDMEKNDPELFDALSQGIRLLQKLTANTTGELLPFTPTGDQEKIESALMDDDFDLNEADLAEIDLSGIEEDLELNDDELADLDLGEFEELKDFVENELMPSKPLTPELYSVLTAVVVAGIGKGDEATKKDIFDLASKERSKGYRIDNAGLKPEENQINNLTWDLFTLEEQGYVNRKADKTFGTVYYSVTDKGNEAILKYPEEQKQVSNAPFDIENLSALEKNILLILDKPPAAEKGTLYNEMTLSEIWAEVDETIASQYSRDLVEIALHNLIDYQLVNELNRVPVEYRNFDDARTNGTISELKKKPTTLTPTTLKILRILYRFTGKLSADNIKDDLSFEKVALPHKAVFTRLVDLRDMGLVQETNTSYGGIVWQITQAGNEYIDKLPKEKTVNQIREEEKQQKAKKIGDGLDYEYYLIAKILNDDTGYLTAGSVTTILQQQFNKTPKWDEKEILLKLQVLAALGVVASYIQNSVPYFEINELGEDVVKYLTEKDNQGLFSTTGTKVGLRPSPTDSATMYNVGTIKVGNDGNNWQIKESKTGVKRWVKMK
jgi:Fe2+ or Zn2+ uptake regulation protein/DNA-binding MarR family transcriptional regulator